MTRHRETAPALATYAEALVGIGGQLTSILHHMYAHENLEAELDPAETLARLIADVMPPNLAQRDVDLKIAARLLNATAETIEDNLLLVADDSIFEEPMNGSDRLH